MDNWLKGLIAAACIVVIVGGGYSAWGEYQHRQQAETSAQSRDDQKRTEDLAADRCFKVVNDIVAEHNKTPITQPSQVSSNVAHDIGLCIRRVPIGDLTKNELERTGLISVFRNS